MARFGSVERGWLEKVRGYWREGRLFASLQQLRRRIEKRPMSFRELSKKFGVTAPTVSVWFGQKPRISSDVLHELMIEFGGGLASPSELATEGLLQAVWRCANEVLGKNHVRPTESVLNGLRSELGQQQRFSLESNNQKTSLHDAIGLNDTTQASSPDTISDWAEAFVLVVLALHNERSPNDGKIETGLQDVAHDVVTRGFVRDSMRLRPQGRSRSGGPIEQKTGMKKSDNSRADGSVEKWLNAMRKIETQLTAIASTADSVKSKQRTMSIENAIGSFGGRNVQ